MNEITLIKEFLIKNVSPYLIILFGSAVRGELRKDSDIDLAFLSDSNFDEYSLFMFAQGLANKLNKEIDLVDLNKASTVFKAQIIGTGREIYNSDENRSAIFKMKTFKEYALLNEERQCILQNIKQRGKIYAQ